MPDGHRASSLPEHDSDLLPEGSRPVAQACGGMVTAPHALAAQIGIQTLAGGGTAADSAVAMAAGLAVIYPHMTGVGGDAFWIYYDAATESIRCYNGSGAAARLADRDYYAQRGCAIIPERGPLAALTVPGAVDGWFALHERFGKLPMTKLLEPAARYAREGVPIARSLAKSLREDREFLDADEGARSIYGSAGINSRHYIGGRLVQPALARTLDAIARHGRAWFYEGEGAGQIDHWAANCGSPLRAADLAAHRGFGCSALQVSFAGGRSVTLPPNSQGFTLLLAQRIYQSYMGKQRPADCSAPFVHAAVESAKLAYVQRDLYLGDPRANPVPLDRLLSDDFAREQGARIDPYASGAMSSRTASGDTTYFACVDAAGNAVSYIQSLYFHFGACVVVPELGVALQNRGVAFTLDEGKPTSLEPGRRPRHTLMPAMLTDGKRPSLVYGSMGGDAQPQIAFALSVRIAERGMNPQMAIEAPRWRFAHGGIAVEERVGRPCVAGLQVRGHKVIVAPAWDQQMGHAGAIVIDREGGVLLGGADPRGDGAAFGI